MEPKLSIYDAVLQHAAESPQKPALRIGSQTITYRGLVDQAREWSQKLSQVASSSVAICKPNSVDHLAVLIAASHLGLNTQILNSDWPALLREKVIGHLCPDVMLTDAGLATGKVISRTYSSWKAEENPFYTGFTSGSTGFPKGYVRSERSWLGSFAADQKVFEFTNDDVFSVPGSMSHSLPLYGVVRGLYAGATVLMQSTFRPDRMVAQLAAEKGTVLIATPTQIRALVDFALRQGIQLETLQKILSAGSKFPGFWLADLVAVFPAAKAFEFYGTSEFSYVSYQELTENTDPKAVGKAFEGVDIVIKGADGAPMPRGEVGTIYIKSPFVFMGYAGAEGRIDTPEFEDGFLTVGDRGSLSAKDDLLLAGRADRMFQSAGRNIQPEEIETALLSIAGVDVATVMGEACSVRENRIVSIIAGKGEISASALVAELRNRLPAYAIPSKFYKCVNWPYTISQKTDLAALDALLKSGKLKRLP